MPFKCLTACLVLSILSSFYTPSTHAAFVVKIKERPSPSLTMSVATYRQLPFSLKKIVANLPLKYRNGGIEGSNRSGTLSFIFGLAGFISLIIALASFATLAWFYLSLLGLALGIAAIILGAPHRNKHRGLGIAGVILGIADVILTAVVFGIVLSGLSALGS